MTHHALWFYKFFFLPLREIPIVSWYLYSSPFFFQHALVQNFHFNSVKNNISIWEQSRIKYSNFLFFIPSTVMVWAWIGKESPDMRQNERKIKFIRMGGTVRTACPFNRELSPNKGFLVHFIHRVQGLGWDLASHLLIGWGTYTEWGKS